MSVAGSIISTTFSYDPNGNQTAGLGRTITWTSYNMPASITQGTQTVSFLHDVNHQRVKQITANGNTLYINAFGVTAELFGAGTAAARWTEYLMVGNARVGMRVTTLATATTSLRHFHTDHLNSIAVITNEAGAVVERLSYDAWGKRRYPNGADDTTGSIVSQTSRGFTGHEELDSVGLVHMNGRVYDALMGRMISADPTVPDPMNAQAWNRYSYVGNDPLAFTDPSGFSWLSSFFRGVSNFFRNNPIFRAIAQAVMVAIITAAISIPIIGPIIAAAASAAIMTGLSGGNLGQMLRAGALAFAQAVAFAGVNMVAPVQAMGATFDPFVYAENVAGSALVGCASSAAAGGSCASGAAAAAVSAGLTPVTNSMFQGAKYDVGQRIGGTLVQATAGGLASVAGGGKFANGAVTAAFQYNIALGPVSDPNMDAMAADVCRGNRADPACNTMTEGIPSTGGGPRGIRPGINGVEGGEIRGPTSDLTDISSRGSRVPNVAVNASTQEFVTELEAAGYGRAVVPNSNVVQYSNGSITYTIRPSDSVGTKIDVYVNGIQVRQYVPRP